MADDYDMCNDIPLPYAESKFAFRTGFFSRYFGRYLNKYYAKFAPKLIAKGHLTADEIEAAALRIRKDAQTALLDIPKNDKNNPALMRFNAVRVGDLSVPSYHLLTGQLREDERSRSVSVCSINSEDSMYPNNPPVPLTLPSINTLFVTTANHPRNVTYNNQVFEGPAMDIHVDPEEYEEIGLDRSTGLPY